jgi:hypothetical protein
VLPSNTFATAFSTISGIFSARSFNFYKEILKLQPIKSVGFLVFFLKKRISLQINDLRIGTGPYYRRDYQ